MLRALMILADRGSELVSLDWCDRQMTQALRSAYKQLKKAGIDGQKGTKARLFTVFPRRHTHKVHARVICAREDS